MTNEEHANTLDRAVRILTPSPFYESFKAGAAALRNVGVAKAALTAIAQGKMSYSQIDDAAAAALARLEEAK